MWYDSLWGCAPLGQSIEGEFFRLDRDRSGTVDIYEMRNFRVATRSLSQEAIRAVFHIFAEPACGQITIDLFRRMYNFVMACDNAFRQMSFGRPEISFEQVAPILAQLQIPAPPPAVLWVVARIDSRHCSPNRMVSFNEFILVVAFFASARSIFQRIDRDRNGTITLNEMDFMNTVAGLP
jgi:Ca2+-binding EF-hand superfamily protein